MISRENPIKASLTVLVGSFIIFAGIMWVVKPEWVKTIDKNGNEVVSTELVVSFAATFSLVAAIMVLLLFSRNIPGFIGGSGPVKASALGSAEADSSDTIIYF